MSSEYAAVLEERFHKGEAIGVQTHQQTNEGGCYGS